jgi:uncharacterized protein YjiK
MKKIYKKCKWYLLAIVFVLFYACKPAANKYTAPEGYNFDQPEKFNMPGSLLEISGFAFNKGDARVVYSIQDEEGKLFRQNWDEIKQTNVRFSSRGDYEDVAIIDETVFVLKSSGTLVVFPLTEINKEQTEQVKEWKKILAKGEYEGLYADEKNQTLYVICKNCDVDKKSKNSSGYVLKYKADEDSITLANEFHINGDQLEDVGHKIKSGLKPSALAKNPRTGEWYMLSSVHKLLVIADPDWKIKAAHQLNSSTFNQPEGIAFDKDFNLYISNEGDEITSGNILKFNYAPLK